MSEGNTSIKNLKNNFFLYNFGYQNENKMNISSVLSNTKDSYTHTHIDDTLLWKYFPCNGFGILK